MPAHVYVREVAVRPGVVPQGMPLLHHPARQLRVREHAQAAHEEGGLDAQARERVQNTASVGRGPVHGEGGGGAAWSAGAGRALSGGGERGRIGWWPITAGGYGRTYVAK